ncbi:Pls/PosA family non-ribosomal peptide synthetase [uncultured Mycolicibacterium sp.]|uniref:Pls/PosA family non-ribosomal peptide synthetase n=1 Tax=uncultured Mycolicibacterium sp. TaxID=2320817 RepID=UPI002617C00D|nr:Pls/PosA family non-ribosomal peptide synthetase [uncultured Mycolicibacterium sp.]
MTAAEPSPETGPEPTGADPAGPEIPAQYLLSRYAPPARTLIDILYDTAARHPHAPAVDDGTVVLTYAELIADIEETVEWLAARGIGRGDRIGIRMPPGSYATYVAIAATLATGAAYVPVDVDDPAAHVERVFTAAGVVAVVTEQGLVRGPGSSRGWRAARPLSRDDAWLLFGLGRFGAVQGVAVTHRSAAALVDAEAQLFCRDRPLGPGDRVLAGHPITSEVSCEEMWLAWRHGACLVPAPRALVRTAADLGAWLVARGVTVVSTAPSVVSHWPDEALAPVRLLVVGGEPCPRELVDRLAVPGREVWNTHGGPETTGAVAAARLEPGRSAPLGLPLAGGDLAVVDTDGVPVRTGEVGELVVGGVGLGRYLDPAMEEERFAPLPTLGWQRAYRTGDLVRLRPDGLEFCERVDGRVRLGRLTVDLGTLDAALAELPGVLRAATAVRAGADGSPRLVGYVSATHPDFDLGKAAAELAGTLPAGLAPTLVRLDDLPTTITGQVDRDALPWPVTSEPPDPGGTVGWVAMLWREVLGAPVHGPDADFFALGGTSLAAAQLVASVRQRYPQVTVADVYDHPRLGAFAAFLDGLARPPRPPERLVARTPRRARAVQALLALPQGVLAGLRWLTWLALGNNVAATTDLVGWARPVSWWLVAAGLVLFVSAPGRLAVAALAVRLLLAGIEPGSYRRGGSLHLRVWLAERLGTGTWVRRLAGTPWLVLYARALGNRVGRGVELRSEPPVTGLATLGDRATVDAEVDLSGHWVDGDVFHVGRIGIGADASVGARAVLAPGAVVGAGAVVAPGSAVLGSVGDGQYWHGSPATKSVRPEELWPQRRPAAGSGWTALFTLGGLLAGLPEALAVGSGVALLGAGVRGTASLAEALPRAVAWTPAAVLVAGLVYALLIVAGVHLCSLGVRAGCHPVRSRVGWQLWAVDRLVEAARTGLRPLYGSLVTPGWLRVLGANVGRGTEISTVQLIPALTAVRDGAMVGTEARVGCAEVGGGWVRVGRTVIGTDAVLGAAAVVAPGRSVPDRAVVAALSAAPARTGAGSSWLGNPPARVRRIRPEVGAPPTRLRGVVELCRVLAVLLSAWLAVAVAAGLQTLAGRIGWGWTVAAAAVLLPAAGVLAAALAVAAKWIVVGRIRGGEPLSARPDWRVRSAEAFATVLAAPWFTRPATGTVALNLWLRALGARIGRGVWCETDRIVVADLVTLADAATVNRGVALLAWPDPVVLEEGATVGPRGLLLPGARVGAGAIVGPGSLLLPGDEVPRDTRWQGNPIAPWRLPRRRDPEPAGAEPAA